MNQSASSHGSKIDRLLESTVSYRDVPVMKDLLVIQKRIRSILEEWLIYCRNSLGVLNPNMYIKLKKIISFFTVNQNLLPKFHIKTVSLIFF